MIGQPIDEIQTDTDSHTCIMQENNLTEEITNLFDDVQICHFIFSFCPQSTQNVPVLEVDFISLFFQIHEQRNSAVMPYERNKDE